MWIPRRGRQQLDLLCHDKRPELRGKAFHEVLVGEDPCPVLPPVGVVIKLPEMDELIDRASVGLEVAHELLVMAALLERREAELLVELRRFRHLADIELYVRNSYSAIRHSLSSIFNLRQQRSRCSVDQQVIPTATTGREVYHGSAAAHLFLRGRFADSPLTLQILRECGHPRSSAECPSADSCSAAATLTQHRLGPSQFSILLDVKLGFALLSSASLVAPA